MSLIQNIHIIYIDRNQFETGRELIHRIPQLPPDNVIPYLP